MLNQLKEKIKNKKIKALLFLFLFFFISIVGVTYAYFTSNTHFENKFKTKEYEVSIEEEFYNNWGTKKVSFVNNNASSLILRVSYNEIWDILDEEAEDTVVLLNNQVNGIDVVTKEWTNAWLNDFVNGNDGWYYYKKVLNSTDRVQVLNRITLNEELIKNTESYENYLNSDYELDFNFESVQADKKAVKGLWDKEITIDNDGNITWNF